ARAWNEGGIAVLFAGPPGTGKTMAAEILAGRLGLPMYRIDLSQVVDKYIGVTEKNLKRLFDAADISDLVLFFDEAAALFGRRTHPLDRVQRLPPDRGGRIREGALNGEGRRRGQARVRQAEAVGQSRAVRPIRPPRRGARRMNGSRRIRIERIAVRVRGVPAE